MSLKIYNKLVRDKIPAIISANGGQPRSRELSEAEYLPALIEKLGEEYEEFKQDQNIEELADLQEVLLALYRVLSIAPADVERARVQKAERRGTFSKQIYLETVQEDE